ncbi:MAG: protein kinase [Elusimicrobia bacterium]|nr:protein kinase [Elusimicrobiota bacterium]
MYFKVSEKRIILSHDPLKNIVQINSMDWQLLQLDTVTIAGRGSNSFIFEAYPLDDKEQKTIVKICRYYNEDSSNHAKQRIARFKREITALELVKGSGHKDIAVDIISHGIFKIKPGTEYPSQLKQYSFHYYVMERADSDLDYFLSDRAIVEQQKLLLCASLLQSLKKLHSLGIYHRDIKPSNILVFGRQWKLADLGLASFRNEDLEIDLPNEKIGPIGWLSPEAVNKGCSNQLHPAFNADTDITDASDIFQLGKLFWYIMYGSVPTGQMEVSDCGMADLFNKIFSPMLQYSKRRRAIISTIESALHPILHGYGA